MASDWTEESRRSRSATHDGEGWRRGRAWRLLAAASRELGALVCFLHNLQEGEKGREMATGVAAASVCLLAERSNLFLRWMKKEQRKIRERGPVRAAREERQEGEIERRRQGGMLLCCWFA